MIGFTIKPKAAKKWAYGLKTCFGIVEDLEQMRKSIPQKHQLVLKEEGQGRTKTGSQY